MITLNCHFDEIPVQFYYFFYRNTGETSMKFEDIILIKLVIIPPKFAEISVMKSLVINFPKFYCNVKVLSVKFYRNF